MVYIYINILYIEIAAWVSNVIVKRLYHFILYLLYIIFWNPLYLMLLITRCMHCSCVLNKLPSANPLGQPRILTIKTVHISQNITHFLYCIIYKYNIKNIYDKNWECYGPQEYILEKQSSHFLITWLGLLLGNLFCMKISWYYIF